MKKMLIAALMAAFAATALPGAAAAQFPERNGSVLLPVAGTLGTANWFLRPKWNWVSTGKILKVKPGIIFGTKITAVGTMAGPKFAGTVGPKFGGYHHRHHHHKKSSTSGGSEFPYVVGAVLCAAASPIITVAIEKRELSTNEVLWSTASCFFPPLALIGLFGGLQ